MLVNQLFIFGSENLIFNSDDILGPTLKALVKVLGCWLLPLKKEALLGPKNSKKHSTEFKNFDFYS
jgi:hypothetical protein